MTSLNEISVIIHYHTCPEKHPQHDAIAVREARELFLREGMIKPVTMNDSILSDVFVTTERGEKFIDMLRDTPFPVTKHIDPREAAEFRGTL